MTEAARSHKRRQESDETLPTGQSQHRSKKQKHSYPSHPPAAFWDNLSEIPLTKNALRELDRRNNDNVRARRRRSHTRVGRPVTSGVTAAWTTDHPAAAAFLTSCTPTCRKHIERSARHGGPDLTDLRDCRRPGIALAYGMSSSQSSLGRRKRGSASPSKRSTPNTTTTKSTGPYDRAFVQHLIDNGVYPERYKYPGGRVPPRPENIEEIRRALAQPRPSLSPSRFSDEEFDKFQQADADASKERQVTTSVIPIIEGNVEDRKCVSGEIPFTNLDHLTDGSLVPGNPDLYNGARPEQLHRQIRAKLNGHIIPSTQHDLPVAPNFFVEVKGPDGSSAVAQRQACYDGALGARGMQSLHSYGMPEPVYDNKASTVMCTYHAGQLKIYTSHPMQPPSAGVCPEYVMTQIKAYALTSDDNTFRQGAGAYRNARDWAKLQRDRAIKQANERAQVITGTHVGIDLGLSFATDVSADDAIEHTSQETLPPGNQDSNAVSFYDSDTSADELSLVPPLKRSKLPREARSTSEFSHSQQSARNDTADSQRVVAGQAIKQH